MAELSVEPASVTGPHTAPPMAAPQTAWTLASPVGRTLLSTAPLPAAGPALATVTT